MIDVTNPGGTYAAADNTGATDCKTALTAMINDKLGALYFPPGRYRLESTLVFPPGTGYHLVGSGSTQQLATTAGSALYWGGPAGGTVVEYGGTGLVWDGLTVWGRKFDTDTNRAAVGIRIIKPAGSLVNTGKMWFPVIMIDDCVTGIVADGAASADSCAFGYFRPRNCDTCIHLNGTGATMFTFRFVLPQGSGTVFKATGGGRLYVHSINEVIKATGGTILDVTGGDISNGFYHINGMAGDGTAVDYHVLQNVDSGSGLQHYRFTNAHFLSSQMSPKVAKVNIDRRNGTGQTVLEFVGCRGLADLGQALATRVQIKGASSSKRSHLFVRDSQILNATQLIDAANSSNYTEERVKNWTFGTGVQ